MEGLATPWGAREYIRSRDPHLGARLDRIMPLPPPPKMCDCEEPDVKEITTLGDRNRKFLCLSCHLLMRSPNGG